MSFAVHCSDGGHEVMLQKETIIEYRATKARDVSMLVATVFQSFHERILHIFTFVYSRPVLIPRNLHLQCMNRNKEGLQLKPS